MSKNKMIQKITAMILSIIMVLGIMMPVSANAQVQDLPTLPEALDTTLIAIEELLDKTEQEIDDKIIKAFTPLGESVAQQSAVLSAPLSELNLPDTLYATLDGEIISVPVTWACTPEYQIEAGEYNFTAVLGGSYILVEGLKTPSITVFFKDTVQPPSAQMELADEEASATVILLQDQTVADISSAIQTALNDTDSNTVVITGSKTNVTSSLSLNIPEGKTVVWEAVFKGYSADYLMHLNGKGTFEVVEGGEINASSGGAIAGISYYSNYDIPRITISGGTVKAIESCAIYIINDSFESIPVTVSGGIVSNAGTDKNPTIHLNGNAYLYDNISVTIKNEGKVISTSIDGIAVKSAGNIRIQDAAEVNAGGTAVMGRFITVESGTISANKTAVFTLKEVLVSGGRVEAIGTDGYAIYASGNVQVSGGTVSAAGDNGAAILSSGTTVVEGGSVSAKKTVIRLSMGNVLVRGGIVRGGNNVIEALGGGSVTVEGGTVEATNVGGNAIYGARNVIVNGGAVSANNENSTAIKVIGIHSYVTIENGTVEAIGVGGKAISAQDGGGILVSGGTVKAGNIAIDFGGRSRTVTISGGSIHADNTAIHILGDWDSTLAISGGTIYGGSIAIHFEGYINPVITVNGGTISGGRNAIRLIASMNPSVTVTGGLVIGCGSKYLTEHDSAAIYMEGGVPTVTSPGTVVAWNKSTGNNLYGSLTEADLASLPENSAKWDRTDGKSGIFYGSGGFFDIDGVSVAEITAEAVGLDKLKVGTFVNATLTYTLTGASYASGLNVIDFAPGGLPDWLSIVDTSVESTAVRISLSGTVTETSEPYTLSLPEKVSATNLTGDGAGVHIPVNGAVAIGTVAKGDGAEIAYCTTASITATEVTLELISGLPNGQTTEYAVSETASPPPSAVWQDIVNFSGLTPNSEYFAFVRSKENEYYSTGAPSSGIRFNTAKAQLSGSVSVSGNPAYGATLTAVTAELCSSTPGVSPGQLGALSYQWWRRSPDGVTAAMIPSATSNNYTISEADVGQIIWVEVMAANCEGTVSGGINKPTVKAVPMGSPAYTEITNDSQTLADAELKGHFLNPHNNAHVPGMLSWDATPNTLVQRGKSYRWTFTAAEEACFHTAYGSIILWPAADESGGSGDDTPPAADTTEPDKTPNQPGTVTTPVAITADADGLASANNPDKAITDAIAKAQAGAKAGGRPANGIAVELDVTMPQGATAVSASISQNALQSLVSAGVTTFTIIGPPVKMTFDLKALQEIQKQSNETINISIAPQAILSDSAKRIIGSRPVYELTVNSGAGKTVSGFGAGNVLVTIPYTLGANEKASNVQAVYVDTKGNVQWLESSVYDSVNSVLNFSTNHFSTYGVGYKHDTPNFADIDGHWAKEDIAFVVNHGLFSGTSKTTFSPNTAMTRGMFVTTLGRLANADVSSYKQSSFTDVKNDAYYMGYIEWANKNNIITGIGDKKFAPNQSVTREQMAVMMQNYAKVIGFTLPKFHAENTFADSTKIYDYAKGAVKIMQMAGVISGKNGNIFDPQGTATRAEVSAVMRRFIELAISSDTAQDWTMNDSGK